MRFGNGSNSHGNRRIRRLLVGATGIALLGPAIVFVFAGRWLVVGDPVGKAHAIAVLSGAVPVRALEAVKLYKEGYASEVWLTHSTEPGAQLQAMGISFLGEDYYDACILENHGVPKNAIRVLDPPTENTADEIRTISRQLEQEKGTAVIIVTSKVHTRRTRLLWRRLAEHRGTAIVRAASEDGFNPARWWNSTRDALDVVREVLGVLNAWAGFPLKPPR